jgi:hypothetical protein
MGYNLQIDGINRVMDSELHNYAITVSFLLRYSPLEVVKHLITKWQDVSVDSLIISEFKDVLLEVLNQYMQVDGNKETTNAECVGGQNEHQPSGVEEVELRP